MGSLEKLINEAEDFIDPEEHKFEIKQRAQMELIQIAGGEDFAGTWIDANAGRFNELINNPQFNFIERLANEDTHKEALAEIQGKLYH